MQTLAMEGRMGNSVAYKIMTVKVEVFFWLERIGIGFLGHRLDTLGDVCEDLLCAKHTIGVQSRVAVNS